MTEMLCRSVEYGMGTVIAHCVFGKHSEKSLHAAKAETTRLEKMLSVFIPDSEISRINEMAGIKKVTISDETLNVLLQAGEYARCSNGSFDVTVGPLVKVWRVLERSGELPNQADILEALAHVDYKELVLDNVNNTAMLKKPKQSIDLGGIGKGYAADQIVKVFKEFGITSACTDFGGNVALLGAKPDGSNWNVGIRHPRQEGSLIGIISVADKSVVTSGDYQRFFIAADGKRYHHIIDPKTGYPTEKGLISVTIVADSSLMADALSTAVFTTGLEGGIEILRAFPGAESILVDINQSVYMTRGLIEHFQAAKDITVKIIDYI